MIWKLPLIWERNTDLVSFNFWWGRAMKFFLIFGISIVQRYKTRLEVFLRGRQIACINIINYVILETNELIKFSFKINLIAKTIISLFLIPFRTMSTYVNKHKVQLIPSSCHFFMVLKAGPRQLPCRFRVMSI